MSLKIKDIVNAIEEFAPKSLKESWDNPGLQVGEPEVEVTSVLTCLDVTEQILDEAISRGCNLILSHHPLLFHGLKSVTGATAAERIVMRALREGVAIYSAHTNLDSARDGVNYEIARALGLVNIRVLEPKSDNPDTGLGVIGDLKPMPTLEFLRRLKELFHVRNLRYSEGSNRLVVRRVGLCGGAGASLIKEALALGADAFVTGDVKYHDFTEYGHDLLLVDIGHYESELCTRKIFSRILHERYPELDVFVSEREKNPIGVL